MTNEKQETVKNALCIFIYVRKKIMNEKSYKYIGLQNQYLCPEPTKMYKIVNSIKFQ